ncbi:MAG: hypothetical protein WEA10_01535 [Actinomycetota bacterium]
MQLWFPAAGRSALKAAARGADVFIGLRHSPDIGSRPVLRDPHGRSKVAEEVGRLKARLIRWFYTVATLAGLVMVMTAGRKWKVPQ